MSETLKDLLVGLVPITVALIGIFGTVISGNKKTIAKVDSVDKKLTNHIEENEAEMATERRARILSFDDNLCRGKQYTSESWDEILYTISEYEKFAEEHKDTYRNNKGTLAMEHIKAVYKKTKESNEFLTHIPSLNER